MAVFKTLEQLRTKVREKAAIDTGGQSVDDTELNGYIQDSIASLYALLYDNTDGSLFAKVAPDLLDIGNDQYGVYQLPDDFGRLVELSTRVSGYFTAAIAADPTDFAALADVGNVNNRIAMYYLGWNLAEGRAELTIFPKVSIADIFVRYTPVTPELSVDTDTLNLPSFWYMWVVYDSAVQVLGKEESDTTGLRAERDRIERSILRNIDNMSLTRVKHVRKSRYTHRFHLPYANNTGGN